MRRNWGYQFNELDDIDGFTDLDLFELGAEEFSKPLPINIEIKEQNENQFDQEIEEISQLQRVSIPVVHLKKVEMISEKSIEILNVSQSLNDTMKLES